MATKKGRQNSKITTLQKGQPQHTQSQTWPVTPSNTAKGSTSRLDQACLISSSSGDRHLERGLGDKIRDPGALSSEYIPLWKDSCPTASGDQGMLGTQRPKARWKPCAVPPRRLNRRHVSPRSVWVTESDFASNDQQGDWSCRVSWLS